MDYYRDGNYLFWTGSIAASLNFRNGIAGCVADLLSKDRTR